MNLRSPSLPCFCFSFPPSLSFPFFLSFPLFLSLPLPLSPSPNPSPYLGWCESDHLPKLIVTCRRQTLRHMLCHQGTQISFCSDQGWSPWQGGTSSGRHPSHTPQTLQDDVCPAAPKLVVGVWDPVSHIPLSTHNPALPAVSWVVGFALHGHHWMWHHRSGVWSTHPWRFLPDLCWGWHAAALRWGPHCLPVPPPSPNLTSQFGEGVAF